MVICVYTYSVIHEIVVRLDIHNHIDMFSVKIRTRSGRSLADSLINFVLSPLYTQSLS